MKKILFYIPFVLILIGAIFIGKTLLFSRGLNSEEQSKADNSIIIGGVLFISGIIWLSITKKQITI